MTGYIVFGRTDLDSSWETLAWFPSYEKAHTYYRQAWLINDRWFDDFCLCNMSNWRLVQWVSAT